MRLFLRSPRTADLQLHITRPYKWRGWQQPARDTAWRLFQGIMLSALNAPVSPLGNRPTNWCCSLMDADANGT